MGVISYVQRVLDRLPLVNLPRTHHVDDLQSLERVGRLVLCPEGLVFLRGRGWPTAVVSGRILEGVVLMDVMRRIVDVTLLYRKEWG